MNKNYNHNITRNKKKKMSVCCAVSQFRLLGANPPRLNTGDSLLLRRPAFSLVFFSAEPTGQAAGS